MLSYDGTNYVGWQIQPNGPSVQQTVEDAIRRLTGETVSLRAAGRTDSGVHAIGQVANFHTASAVPVRQFQSGLHNFLPDDIAVRRVDEVGEDFHATYRATRKHYRYVIHNSRIRHPFLGRYAWRVSRKLNVIAMQQAARELVGTYDFRCFESHFPNKASSVRTVSEAIVSERRECPMWNATGPLPGATRSPSGIDEFIWLDFAADGFLYNMVRAMTGTLVNVGLGRWTPADVCRIINSRDRSQAGETAPPHGLYLLRVDYGAEN